MTAEPTTVTRAAPPVLCAAFGLFLLGFSLGFPGTIQPHDPGVAAVPRLAGVALVVLSVTHLATARNGDGNEAEPLPTGRAARRGIALVVLLCGYALAFPMVGYTEGVAGFLFLALLVSGVRSVWSLGLVPVGVSLVSSYAFYYFLQVSLPTGVVGGVLFG